MPQSGLTLLQAWLLLCCLMLAASPLSAQEPESPPAANPPLTLSVEGVDGPLRDNVLAYLELNRFADQPAPDEVRLRWLHNNAEREIRKALEPFGYFEPTIEASLTRTPEAWTARYRITPGRSLRIAEIDVKVLGEGAQDPAFQKLLDNLPLAQGQTLTSPNTSRSSPRWNRWRPNAAISTPALPNVPFVLTCKPTARPSTCTTTPAGAIASATSPLSRIFCRPNCWPAIPVLNPATPTTSTGC